MLRDDGGAGTRPRPAAIPDAMGEVGPFQSIGCRVDGGT